MGTFIASALNLTLGATFGWRAMFLSGIAPVVIALFTLYYVKEPERWTRQAESAKRLNQLAAIFRAPYLGRTLVMTGLLSGVNHRLVGRLGLCANRHQNT